tara:strand:+ start:293 stop:412 length:120 start_codon:yes stop_codon:yes gene_type:complete
MQARANLDAQSGGRSNGMLQAWWLGGWLRTDVALVGPHL